MNYLPTLRRLLSNSGNLIRNRPAILFSNILLTYHCTQRCLQCAIPVNNSIHNNMSTNAFTRIVRTLAEYGTQGISLSGGEPMCHPYLPEFIEIAAGHKFYNLQILTTLYASDKIVTRTIDAILRHNVNLSCSFDGFDQVADRLRGTTNTSTIVSENILRFHKANQRRSKPVKTYLNIVLSRLNLPQFERVLAFAHSVQWPMNIDLYRWTSENHREQEEMKIDDLDLLASVVTKAKNSPLVITPSWLLDGYVDYLEDRHAKHCPYLDNPGLGSKFFIHPNGDVKLCMGPAIGNLTRETPQDIFASPAWHDHIRACHACRGCWNTCYTPVSRPLRYFNQSDLKIVQRLISTRTERTRS